MSLLSCVSDAGMDPTKCVELKGMLAACMQSDYEARQRKSTLWADVSRYVFRLDKRDMHKAK